MSSEYSFSEYSLCPQSTVYVHRVQLMFPVYVLRVQFMSIEYS